MSFRKLFNFTQQLEDNLKKLSEMPTISAERKEELLKKLEILSIFNKRHDAVLNLERSSHRL